MKKKWKIIRSLFILSLLLLVINNFIGASLTPLSAHKRSERTANYGPSTIIRTKKINGGMLYLCKYDKWFSLSTVKRGFLGLWYAGDMVLGDENNLQKAINFSLGTRDTWGNYRLGIFYGIINEPSVKTVKFEIILNGKLKTFEQSELYDNMFLFTWDEDTTTYRPINVIGLDKDSKVVFKEGL